MLMGIFEQEMATQGEVIYAKRDVFVREFIPVFQMIYGHVPGRHKTVLLQYISHAQHGLLLDVTQRDRHRDRAAGYSFHGAHHDDLEMMVGNYQLKCKGSQGQNKTYMLVLKLARSDFPKRAASSTTPLLLLDDISDKLGAGKVEHIVNMVAGDVCGQVFITDTD